MNTVIKQIKRCMGEILLLLLRQKKPLVVVMVDGGFCSVLAKYLIGRFIQEKCGASILYDLSWFKTSGVDCDGKDGRKLQFNDVFPSLHLPAATAFQSSFFKCFFYRKNPTPFVFDPTLGDEKHAYLDGYFMHWKYFDQIKHLILEELDIGKIQLDEKNEDMLADIKSREASVAIHIRRGDYVNMGWCILTPAYYLSAIDYLIGKLDIKGIHLYIFSNGMEWSKEHILDKLPPSVAYTMVDINDNDHGHLDLRLIAECDHQISSNSSFGFWGGLLNKNKNKIVIIPDQWLPEPRSQKEKGTMENSEQAHRVLGWTVFSTQQHVPLNS